MDPSMKNMTVMELVRRYLATRTGAKPSTLTNYRFVLNLLEKEDFSGKRIGDVKTSDAKLFLIKMQADGKGYSSVKTVRGVLRPAFQMAVDDDYLQKNPFGFQLAGVVINDSVTREAITKDQMRKFLKFVHDDNNYGILYFVPHRNANLRVLRIDHPRSRHGEADHRHQQAAAADYQNGVHDRVYQD